MITDPVQVDRVSGQTTTGHEWDGIRELNTPLPRWWLWLFYLTIVFSVGYWIVYPAWPLASSYTTGLFGYTNRTRVAEDVAAGQAARMQMAAGLEKASLAQIAADPKLLEIALAQGKAAFGDNCTPCHGSGGQGQKGYPNLTAGRWLWGGTLDQIHDDDHPWHPRRRSGHAHQRHAGLRQGRDPEAGADPRGRQLRPDPRRPRTRDRASTSPPARRSSRTIASLCHGEDGKGNIELGSANLTTKVWQYGSDINDLIYTITNARNSTMPAWGKRLDPVTIKSLAVYVHSLGGGK